jgi:hypothetical protein
MYGATLSQPYEFLKRVFPQWNGEPAYSDGSIVVVTFDQPQNPQQLGPMVLVEEITDNLNQIS